MRRLFYAGPGADFWLVWDSETGLWKTLAERPTNLDHVNMSTAVNQFGIEDIERLVKRPDGFIEQWVIPPELQVSEGL